VKASVSFWLRLFVGGALIVCLLAFVDWQETIATVLAAAPVPAAVGISFLFIKVFVSSVKWKLLLRAQGVDVSWWRLLRCYWISTFFGNYLPTTFGGDVVRLVMMRDLGYQAQVAASIFWERATGFFVLLVWSGVGLAARPQYFRAGHVLPFLWAMVGGGIVLFVCLVLFAGTVTAQLRKLSITEGTLAEKFVTKLIKVAESVTYYQRNKGVLLVAILLSIPAYGSVVFYNYRRCGEPWPPPGRDLLPGSHRSSGVSVADFPERPRPL
jgi:uncharacterized protein (TIRG00374 family)